MAQSLTDIKSDAITSVIANTISTINSTVSNVANNVTTLTSTVGNVAANVSNVQSTITTLVTPKISSITYPGDDTAAVPAGGQTITLTGTGFNSGASVLINGTYASVVSVVSSTSITFTAPAMAAGTYILYVINTDGGTSISIPGISYSGTPIWSTSAGTLGTIYETSSISSTLTATGDAPITYSLFSGTLPPGSSLNSSSGLLSGTSQGVASSTTYNFTIRATDGQNQDTDRAFSITLNPDVVTWNSPADGTSTALFQNQAMSNVTLSATSVAGKSITYTANALPTGVTITGAVVNGTPTIVGTTNSLITATAATTNKTSTRNFTWVVSLANDTYFNNTTLLLNGETTVTPFISDASTNSFPLTINGDTKPVLFNPYQEGYYSNYFDGTGDYLSAGSNSSFAVGTGDFTFQVWVYPTAYTSPVAAIFDTGSAVASGRFSVVLYSSGLVYVDSNANLLISSSTLPLNAWTLISIIRSSGTMTMYFNGTSVASGSIANNFTETQSYIGRTVDGYYFQGYISNLRLVKGTALANTVPTTPLTAIANTSLLTCQSNRLIDNSTNAFTITKNGDVSVSPNIPFTPNSSYSTYGSTYFDGTGDYLSTPNSSAFAFGTSNFTVEMWVYANSASTTHGLIGASTAGVYWSALIFSGTLYWQSQNGSVNLLTTSYAGYYDRWTHIAFVRNSGTTTLYLNGVSITSASSDTTNYTLTAGTIDIGRDNDNGPAYMNGYISDVRVVKGTAVYTSAFTPPTTPLTAITNTQLLTLQYNGGATNQGIIDNSNFNNIITRNGNVSQGSFSPYSVTGWSTYFNGVNDYLTFSSVADPTGDFNIEFWWNPPNLAGSTYYEMFTKGVGLQIYYYNGMQVALSSSNSGTYFLQAGFGNVTPNLWNHIAVVRNGNSYTGYINGVGTSLATSSSAFTTGGAVTFIGSYSSGYYTPGYFSNVRYVVGTAVYTANFTPPTTPLTAISGTRLLTCQSNRFIDNSPNNLPVTIGSAPKVQAFSPFGSISEATPLSYSTLFTGSNTDNLSVADNDKLDAFTDFTIECWVYFTSVSGGVVLSKGWDGGSLFSPYLIFINSGDLVFTGTSASGSWDQLNKVIISSVAVNTWYHVAVTRSGSSLKLFSNGALITTISYGTTLMNSTSAFTIGSAGTGYNPMTGYVSNVRIIKGTALYTSAFTPSTTPLTTTSQGATASQVSFLGCQNTTQLDNSSNAFAVSQTGSPKVYKHNPFGYTAQSATSYTPSLHGGSIYLDGTGDNLLIPYTLQHHLPGDFTIEFWMYWTSAISSMLINKGGGSNIAWASYEIYVDSASNNVRFAASTTNTGYDIGGESTTGNMGVVSINTWTHVAVTRSGNTFRGFVNGVQGFTATSSSALYDTSPRGLTVGSNYSNTWGTGTPTAVFPGYINDLRITKGTAIYTSNFVPPTQTLTNYSTSYPASLLLNMNNGGIIDQHSTNVLETVGGTQLSTAVKKYASASMRFDGSGDYINMPYSPSFNFGTGDFTIECWANITYVQYSGIISSTNSTMSSSMWLLGFSNTDHIMTFNFDGNGAAICGADYTAYEGVWTHIAVSRSGTTLKLFFNGTQVQSVTNSTSFTGDTANPVTIGRRYNNQTQYYMNGYIDDLRITKGVARYTTTFTPPTSALVTK